MGVLRVAAPTALVYLGYLVAFPDWGGRLYHALAPLLLAGGAVGLWFLLEVLDLGAGRYGAELAFVALAAVLIGYTLPQKSGKPPLTQWAEGARPAQPAARRGAARLGLDPDRGWGARVVALFPK